MTEQKHPSTYISEPIDSRIYILERSRKGSRKLRCSAMPEAPTDVDRPITLRQVPLRVRRAARKHLGITP